MRQLGFLPAGLGANLAVRREAFEAVGGFAEELLIGEDIDLCWRLQLEGYRFVIEFGAVVAKRERPGFRRGVPAGLRPTDAAARPSTAGTGGPGPGGTSAARPSRGCGWSCSPPAWPEPGASAIEWARAAGMRTGRLAGSLRERVFFP